MVTLVRLESDLFKRLELFFPQGSDFTDEDGFGRHSRIDTVCLDRDHDMAALLQEIVGVDCDDTCLIWLSDVGKDDIDR